MPKKLEKQSISDGPNLPPVPQSIPGNEAGPAQGAFAASDVQVKFIRYSDSDFDDHDSIEECYGIDRRRGPWEPKKNKKKTKKGKYFGGN